MSSLNDIVAAVGSGIYNAGKAIVSAGRTQDEIVADAGGNLSFNEALSLLAQGGAPIITLTALSAIYDNTAFSQQITAYGSPTIEFTVTAGSLPAGLSLSIGGLLSGTPTTEGAYDFTVTATNGEGSDTQQYTGTVLAEQTVPSITTTSLGSMTENTVFSEQIVFTGNPTPTLAVISGSLPAGLSMSSGGLISGTPTTPGAYSFTVRATNSQGVDDQAYSGTVAAGSVGDFFLLLESGDRLLLESGDKVLL